MQPIALLVWSNAPLKNKIDERLYYLIYLDKNGRKIDEFRAPGARKASLADTVFQVL
jgi:hypothetical protein